MLPLKKSLELSACMFLVLSAASGCATDIGAEGIDDAEAVEVGVSEQAMRCNSCFDDPDNGEGSFGGPPASPSNPDGNGWTGMHSDFVCVLELITHPVGYVGNRALLPLLRDADILNSVDDCYAMADGKSEVAGKIVGFLSLTGPIAEAIAKVATFNIGQVNRCVCEEFKW